MIMQDLFFKYKVVCWLVHYLKFYILNCNIHNLTFFKGPKMEQIQSVWEGVCLVEGCNKLSPKRADIFYKN